MDAPYPFRGCRNARIPISHAHITLWTFADLLLVHYETSYIPKSPINRKRENQYVRNESSLNSAAKLVIIFDMCK